MMMLSIVSLSLSLCIFYSWHLTCLFLLILMLLSLKLFPLFFDYIFFCFNNDSLSFSLFLLSAFLSILMLYSMFNYYNNNNNYFILMFLISSLFFFLVQSFFSSNGMMFYFFFECSLIPTFFLIMGWGFQPERLQASLYFMFYTLFASLPLLLVICFLYSTLGSISFFSTISYPMVEKNLTFWLLSIFLFLAFLVKLPMFLFHLWLPKAHVEAPVCGSMVLAGVLLKLGGYGIIRFSQYSLSSLVSISFFLVSLSISGMFFVGLMCCRLNDLKALIAYSSVAHMGLVLSGILTYFIWGSMGGLLMMISHGLSSSGLFCIVNMYYERFSSRSFFLNKGIIMVLPSFSLLMFLLCVSNISAPPTINLLSEIFLLYSVVQFSPYVMMLFPLGSFLGAVFTFYLFSFTQHGKIYGLMYGFYPMNSREYHVILMHLIPINLLLIKSSFLYL